jgi:hypothetical protein
MTSVDIAIQISQFIANLQSNSPFQAILKFWPNEFRISSVTNCPKFLLYRPFLINWP